MDIAEFLLARIAEDEADAFAASRGVPWWPYERPSCSGVWASAEQGGRGYRVATLPRAMEADHIARWDPVRVLAECEAKRRIVEEHPQVTVWSVGENYGGDRIDEPEWFCGRCVDTSAPQPWTEVDRVEYPCPTLRFLALPYADHPDYQQEWKP